VTTKTKPNKLVALAEIGQSPWYDNIERRFIKNGHLKELFDRGILGVTSNPTIFEKAVSSSNEYDKEIKELSSSAKSVLEIYDALTIKDISDAADLLRDTYEKTNHLDGYVSIEVLPEYASDAEKTVESARAIFKRIDKPNIMIKVPGTKKGFEAVRKLTADGINVNVTLLFSIEHYEASRRAYIEGLKERIREKKDIKNIFSVASVFVSRVDTKIDKLLDDLKEEGLKGKAAVANCKMIYRSFKESSLKGGDFHDLRGEGANAQRVLWASTSTKSPLYNDVKYVEELIGHNTVNTMPPKTIDAFRDHGTVELTVEKDIQGTRSALARLKALGIDIGAICQEIQNAGVKSFQDSFDKLIHAIEEKTK